MITEGAVINRQGSVWWTLIGPIEELQVTNGRPRAVMSCSLITRKQQCNLSLCNRYRKWLRYIKIEQFMRVTFYLCYVLISYRTLSQ